MTRSQTELSWQQSHCVKGIIPQAGRPRAAETESSRGAAAERRVGAPSHGGEAPWRADSGGTPGYPLRFGGALQGRYEAGLVGDQPAERESALDDGSERRESVLPVCSCCRLPLVVLERDRRLVAQR